MIYIKFRSVNLPAALTNKRSHVAVDLIRKYEVGEIARLEFVSKVSYRYKKEWYVIQVWTNCGKTNTSELH